MSAPTNVTTSSRDNSGGGACTDTDTRKPELAADNIELQVDTDSCTHTDTRMDTGTHTDMARMNRSVQHRLQSGPGRVPEAR